MRRLTILNVHQTSDVQPAGRMQPSLGFSCSESVLHTDNQSLVW